MSRQHHYIKILPQHYRAIENGDKRFEVRFNDRNYQIHDILHLQEYLNGEYTGREIYATVSYILDDENFCKEGFVIMSLKDLVINN